MVGRKRTRAEMEHSSTPTTPEVPETIKVLRNMWEFASLMQYIYMFGKVIKIDDNFDIEDLENESLKPNSQMLADIGLDLLKFVSSHRGLTFDKFDDYSRRQYVSKAPNRNPFGTEEEPRKFADFDIFTKIRVLWQFSQWTFINPDRIRERMPESKDWEQTEWRMEEVGYDRHERLYFVLDDNRLYRRTDPELPSSPKPKPKNKPRRRTSTGAHWSKKRRAAAKRAEQAKQEAERNAETLDCDDQTDDDTFGGRKWECIAITLEEYKDFLASIEKSRDSDEKFLHKRLTNEVLPVIEQIEEDKRKKVLKHEKELIVLEKLAHAKRSSRIAERLEKEREEHEQEESRRKQSIEEAAKRKEEIRHEKMEEARRVRIAKREQRIQERDLRRKQREEELLSLSEDSKNVQDDSAHGRKSERHLHQEMEKWKRELEKLEKLKKEDDWFFDCSVCGVYGENVDDGSHSIACEKCNVWQHSACHDISKEEAERSDFHFVCEDCKRKIEDAKKPKIPPLKFRFTHPSTKPSQTPKNGTVPIKSIKLEADSNPLAGNDGRQRRKRNVKQNHEQKKPKLPSMKKPKPMASVNPPKVPPGMHNYRQNILNGPTLTPGINQQRYSSLYLNGVSANLPASPLQQRQSPPMVGFNGFMNGLPNGYPALSPQSSPSNTFPLPQQSTVNGISPIKHPHVASSPPAYAHSQIMSNSVQTPGSRPSTAPFSTPQSHNPFLNTIEYQRPTSAHSLASNSVRSLPSPILNRPDMSPTQGNKDVGPLLFPNVGRQNFNAVSPISNPSSPTKLLRSPQTILGSNYSPSPSILPPISPTKFSPTSTSYIHPSSPAIKGAPYSGISPIKHSPPRQPEQENQTHEISNTSVWPPVESLIPNPKVEGGKTVPEKQQMGMPKTRP